MNEATGGTEPEGAAELSEIEEPDELHRRIARPGADGKLIEVLSARRGVTMRRGPVGGGGGSGDLNPVGAVVGLLIDLVISLVATAVIEVAAEGRPWKVKVYRRHGPFNRRLHQEVLPRGVEPEARMRELLDQYAPNP